MSWLRWAPDDLAEADFPGPVGRAGRRQVHEVDAGDQQDEKRDQGKNAHVLDVALGKPLEFEPGMQMDGLERLEVEPGILFEGRLSLEVTRNLGEDALQGDAFSQVNPGRKRAVAPAVDRIIQFPAVDEGDEDVEPQARIGRERFS